MNITDKDCTNLIMHVIEESPTIKKLASKYYEVFSIKYGDRNIEELELEFEELIKAHISSKLKYLSSKDSIKKQQKQIMSPIFRLKERWIDVALKSKDEDKEWLMKKEFQEVKKYFFKNNGEITLEGLTDINDFYEYREKKLLEWKSHAYLISDFEYLSELTPSKIKSAFKHDVYRTLLDILMTEYDGEVNNIYEKNICELPTGMFQTLSKGPKTNGTGIRRSQSKVFSSEISTLEKEGNLLDVSYDFNLNDVNLDILNLLGGELSDINNKKVITKIALDTLDLEIIRFIYNNNNNNNDQCFFELNDLLKKLNLRVNTYNTKKIEEKLLKLPYYAFYIESTNADNTNTDMRATFNFFSEVIIKNIGRGKRLVSISFSNGILANKISTQHLYKSQLKKLNSTDAVNVAYFLENKRVQKLKNSTILEPLNVTLKEFGWYIFIDKVKYNSMNKQVAYISSVLDKILFNDFIIDSYTVDKYSGIFSIKLKEDTKKRKLLTGNLNQ